MITFLVGDPHNPSFATVTGRGGQTKVCYGSQNDVHPQQRMQLDLIGVSGMQPQCRLRKQYLCWRKKCRSAWMNLFGGNSCQWLFLVPLKGLKGGIGSIVHPTIGRKNTTYIPLIVLAEPGGWYICYRSHPPFRGSSINNHWSCYLKDAPCLGDLFRSLRLESWSRTSKKRGANPRIMEKMAKCRR